LSADADKLTTTVPDLLKAVNSASDAAQKSRLLFVSILIYLLLTVTAITQVDLLQDTPATLPLISLKVPLVGFFVVAPAILVAAHFYLLLQVRLRVISI
jgi:hypothetical protein